MIVSSFTMKLVHIVSWIAVLCITIGTSVSKKVNIGAIFNLDTIDGNVSRIAMEAAVKEINSDPSILGGHTLSLSIHDSGYSGFLSVLGALQFMETDTVAIIGPQSSKMAHILSHVANKIHVPLLSFTALDPGLSPIQYPYFFQTAPNDVFQMTAIAETVSYYGWAQVIAIFSADVYSRNGITVLREKLTERRCKISYKAVLPLDIRDKESVVLQELAKVKKMESRVLVVHTLATYGPIILRAAEKLGMMGDGYIWIATSWLPSILDAKPQPEISKMAQGVITYRLHTPDSQRKKVFVARWNQLSNGSIGLNAYGLYAYDTVWLLARAMKVFLDQGNNITFSKNPFVTAIEEGDVNLTAFRFFDGGARLLNIILDTNMTGLTGPIWFTSNRFLPFPSYDVINIVGNELRRIGYWSDYSGLSVVEPEILRTKPQNRSSASQKLYGVVWPGGTKKQPRGWVFPRDGRKLRVGVPHRTSFQGFVYLDNHTRKVQGYCIDVFLAAIKLLPYAVPYEFILFGDGHQNPNYSELVTRISVGEIDAAVGDIAIVPTRSRMVDFAQPYIDSGLIVVVPVKKLSSSAWTFFRPFTPQMWAVVAAFLLIVGVIIWILEHRLNDEFRGSPRKQLMTILWFSFSSLFFAHRQDTVSLLGRMILVIWLFVVLILQQSYTASLTSFLTVAQLSSPIKGIDSLMMTTAPIGYQVGSYAENYLNEELNIPKSRLKPLKSPEEYADALEKGRVAAVVDETPYVDLFLANYCQFAAVGKEFSKRGWGFAFQKDSPLALDMSTALLELSENGGLQNITEKWLKNRTACTSDDAINDSNQLKLENFIGLFVICGVACIVSLIIYLCLMVYRYHQHLLHEPEALSSSSSSRSSHLRTFLSFADKKKDLSQRRSKRKRFSMSSRRTESMEVVSRGQSFEREESDIYQNHSNSGIWIH